MQSYDEPFWRVCFPAHSLVSMLRTHVKKWELTICCHTRLVFAGKRSDTPGDVFVCVYRVVEREKWNWGFWLEKKMPFFCARTETHTRTHTHTDECVAAPVFWDKEFLQQHPLRQSSRQSEHDKQEFTQVNKVKALRVCACVHTCVCMCVCAHVFISLWGVIYCVCSYLRIVTDWISGSSRSASLSIKKCK